MCLCFSFSVSSHHFSGLLSKAFSPNFFSLASLYFCLLFSCNNTQHTYSLKTFFVSKTRHHHLPTKMRAPVMYIKCQRVFVFRYRCFLFFAKKYGSFAIFECVISSLRAEASFFVLRRSFSRVIHSPTWTNRR